MTKSRLITGLAIALGLVALTFSAVRADPGREDESSGDPSNRRADTCESMPALWSGAIEISYDPDDRTVTFIWEDGAQSTLRDTDPGCPDQPGLEAELRGNREGFAAQERVDCANLRSLVDEVRAERSSHGQSSRGRVPVSLRAAEAAARRTPGGAEDANTGRVREKHAKGGPWTIDLDQADQVLARCPQ